MNIAMRAGEASAVVVHATCAGTLRYVASTAATSQRITASQLPADSHLAISVNPMHPKNRLRYIKIDSRHNQRVRYRSALPLSTADTNDVIAISVLGPVSPSLAPDDNKVVTARLVIPSSTP